MTGENHFIIGSIMTKEQAWVRILEESSGKKQINANTEHIKWDKLTDENGLAWSNLTQIAEFTGKKNSYKKGYQDILEVRLLHF